MRLCCNDNPVNPTRDMAENEKAVKRLHDIGFRVIGAHGVGDATDDQVKRLRDLCAKYDMVVAMSPTGYQVAHPDPEQRRKDHTGLRETLRKMRLIGGDFIHTAGGSFDGGGWWHHPKNFTQEGLDELVTEMKKAAPYAEEYGICICPETTQWCILNSPERMREFVDRVGSAYVKITFDFVNHMRPDRIYESGRFAKCVLAMLGDRIGQLHVKDVDIKAGLVVHINETPMGTGLLDHETIIEISDDLEPWKTFSLEHFNEWDILPLDQAGKAYNHIQSIANRIGHTWGDAHMTRQRWMKMKK